MNLKFYKNHFFIITRLNILYKNQKETDDFYIKTDALYIKVVRIT
jgi:hypothetical protein